MYGTASKKMQSRSTLKAEKSGKSNDDLFNFLGTDHQLQK